MSAAASSYRDVVERSWQENRLLSVLVELTYRCNLDCFFCYNDTKLVGQPLSLEQYVRFFDELADHGVLNLTLSGGEPLAHPDFFRLGRAARDRGFVVRVKSNGHALGPALSRRLKEEVDPFIVETSLHGACAETHDRQTRVPGSFVRLVDNLGAMLAAGLRVKINSTLTSWNEREIEAMYALADRFSIPIQFDPEVTPRDDGSREPQTIAASREGLHRLLRLDRERLELRQQGSTIGRQADDLAPLAPPKKHCGAGSNGITVDPYGNVYPCVQWRRPVGNLHQSSLREIWGNSGMLREIREVTEQVAAKLAHDFGSEASLLNFCPGNAWSATGDPTAVYDVALARREATLAAAAPLNKTRLPVVS